MNKPKTFFQNFILFFKTLLWSLPSQSQETALCFQKLSGRTLTENSSLQFYI